MAFPCWFGAVDRVGGEFDDLGRGEDLGAKLLDGVNDVTSGATDDVRCDGLGEVGIGPVRPPLGQVRDDLVGVDDPLRQRRLM